MYHNGSPVMGCLAFTYFFFPKTPSFIRFTVYKSAQKLIVKNFFWKILSSSCPGEILKYFGCVNDVTRKVHLLHGWIRCRSGSKDVAYLSVIHFDALSRSQNDLFKKINELWMCIRIFWSFFIHKSLTLIFYWSRFPIKIEHQNVLQTDKKPCLPNRLTPNLSV